MKTKISEIYLSLLLIAAILIVVNILGTRHFLRLDFTRDKEYTLSKATKTLIRNLDEPVTIIAYFSKDLPSDLATLRRHLINTLQDYKSISKGKIVYKVIDPNKSEELEAQAMRDGIAPIIVQVREKDQAKQQKAYMGIVLKYKDKKDVISYIPPNSSLEYLISKSIKKLTTEEKPVIGILQGYSTPSFTQMQAFVNELGTLYKPQPFYYDSTSFDPGKYDVIAIVSPKDSLPPAFFRDMDKYLQAGGKIFIADDAVQGNLNANPPIGSTVNNGIDQWLKKYGLQIYKSFVTDARCANIQVEQGNFPIPISVPFPYFPIITTFADHPITKGLEAVVMSFVSPMEFKPDSLAKVKTSFTPLAYTSKKTGLEAAPVFFSTYKQWSDSDFPYQNLIVGGILKGDNWQMVIFGDGDFLQLPGGERFQRSDNIALAVNSIDYLADDLGLVQLRTKGIKYKPLKQLDDSTKIAIKYINFLLPIILVLLLGLWRSRYNKNKRNKLKND